MRRSYEAFARDDIDGVVADMDPDIEWHQAQGLPHGGVYRGLDEVRRAIFDPLDDEWWDDFSADPDEFVDAGESVVVLGRYTGRARRPESRSTSRSRTSGRSGTARPCSSGSSSTRPAGSTPSRKPRFPLT